MTERVVVGSGSAKNDVPTLCAIAVLVYLAATFTHEALGHAGITLLLGGHVKQITSAACDCDTSGLSPWAARAVFAGGCVANVVVGALALALCRPGQRRVTLSYALWLLGHVNLFIAFGYLMTFPFMAVGDWHDFEQGLSSRVVWQLALTVLGVCGYAATMWHARISLEPYLSGVGSERTRQAFRLTIVPYVVGGAVEVLSAVVGGPGILVLISAAPATFGGTIGLPILSRIPFPGRRAPEPATSDGTESTGIPRSIPLQAIGVVAGMLYIFWFGGGLLR